MQIRLNLSFCEFCLEILHNQIDTLICALLFGSPARSWSRAATCVTEMGRAARIGGVAVGWTNGVRSHVPREQIFSGGLTPSVIAGC